MKGAQNTQRGLLRVLMENDVKKLMMIAMLLGASTAHAEPSQAVKDWLPQLDKNIAAINALNDMEGKTVTWHREGYTIVMVDRMNQKEIDGNRDAMRRDPRYVERFVHKQFIDTICKDGNGFAHLLDLGLFIEVRLSGSAGNITTRLLPGECK